jgi:hypothetical protein
MIVWGGKDWIGGPAGPTSTGGSYNPIANSWSPISRFLLRRHGPGIPPCGPGAGC